jgi:hypothetical protein
MKPQITCSQTINPLSGLPLDLKQVLSVRNRGATKKIKTFMGIKLQN